MTEIQILSVNVRGLADRTKRKDVFNYLKEQNALIYCIQDIHCKRELEKKYQQEWGGNVVISSFSTNSRGVGIFFNDNFDYKIHDRTIDQCGNFILLDLEIGDHRFTLVTIYGPNRDDPLFYENLRHKIANFDNASLIIVGDWNLVMEQHLDTKHYTRENNIRAKNEVKKLIECYNLFDIWRINNPKCKRYTWKQRNPLKMARLDFFLVTEDFCAICHSPGIKTGYRTDHSIVTLPISLYENKRGKGFWKLNTSFLREIEYVNMIKERIKVNIERYSTNNNEFVNNENINLMVSDQLFFDTLKMDIRGETIKYASRKKGREIKAKKSLKKKF